MRDKLIAAAIRRFGKFGLDGTGTRDIAADAGTTMSNITYHFGSKDGLYRAAAEAIVQRFRDVTAAQVAAVPGEGASPDERTRWVCAILRSFGAFMLSDEAKPLAIFVAREQQDPGSVMREYFARDVHPEIDKMEAQVRALRPELAREQCKATVFFLLSMAISLRSSRLSLCIFMDVTDIDETLGAMLLDRLEVQAREVLEAGR
ncbi:MAG: CerR family C-terminal domain-containing protein [Alteraurantiacibacter sp.]